MLEYIKNILPRIEKFSKTLDHIELFVDQPWVYIDNNNNRYQYIFLRNGDLLYSLNGNAKLGSWKYISPARSLLLTIDNKMLLLNHAFVDNTIMFLKKDGYNESFWYVINENNLPDLDIENYFRKNFSSILKRNAQGNSTKYNTDIIEDSDHSARTLFKVTYIIDNIEYTFEKKKIDIFSIGDKVTSQISNNFCGTLDVTDNFGKNYHLTIFDGSIEKIALKNHRLYLLVPLIPVILILIFIFVAILYSSI